MLKVRNDLCIGCGLCVESCPQLAISLRSGRARINQEKCTQCGICINTCLQGAIVELVTVSREELESTINSLKLRADELIYKIERQLTGQE